MTLTLNLNNNVVKMHVLLLAQELEATTVSL